MLFNSFPEDSFSAINLFSSAGIKSMQMSAFTTNSHSPSTVSVAAIELSTD